MKKNLAKLYDGINTIIYVKDTRTYKYWDEKNDSKECIVSPLDVENVKGDLKVCDSFFSVSQYNYHVYLKWLISEEYIEGERRHYLKWHNEEFKRKHHDD